MKLSGEKLPPQWADSMQKVVSYCSNWTQYDTGQSNSQWWNSLLNNRYADLVQTNTHTHWEMAQSRKNLPDCKAEYLKWKTAMTQNIILMQAEIVKIYVQWK